MKLDRKTRELVEALLALPDWALATVYSEWSEDCRAAGWYSDGGSSFVDDVLQRRWKPSHRELTHDYEREGVATIRRGLQEGIQAPKAAPGG